VHAVAAQLGEEAGDTESLGVAGTALEAPALVYADRSYASPAGVHLGLWRFLQLGAGTSACPADPADAPGAVVLGYATEPPDRLRAEYAATGQLLSMTDAAGVELRYVYQVEPAPGVAASALTYVYEPRSCGYTRPSPTDPGQLPAGCRNFGLHEVRSETGCSSPDTPGAKRSVEG